MELVHHKLAMASKIVFLTTIRGVTSDGSIESCMGLDYQVRLSCCSFLFAINLQI